MCEILFEYVVRKIIGSVVIYFKFFLTYLLMNYMNRDMLSALCFENRFEKYTYAVCKKRHAYINKTDVVIH